MNPLCLWTVSCLYEFLIIAIFSKNYTVFGLSVEECRTFPNKLWDTESSRCVTCPECPPGTEYTGTIPCGNGIVGVRGKCQYCEEGEFQTKYGSGQCTTCTDCSTLNRIVLRNCSNELMNSFDSICGRCLDGFLSSSGSAKCLPYVEVPGYHTAEPTAEDEIFTLHTKYSSGAQVEELTSIKHYWWIVIVSIAIIVGGIFVVMVIHKYRQTYGTVVDFGRQAADRPTISQQTNDNSSNPIRETQPFIAIDVEEEVNISRKSSGYSSQPDPTHVCEFPRDPDLKCRYEKAKDILETDERCNKTVMDCNFNILQQLSTELNRGCPPGTKNWKHLGSDLDVPNKILDIYESGADPLMFTLRYADTHYALKLNVFLQKLKGVENHKALDIMVSYVLEQRSEKMLV